MEQYAKGPPDHPCHPPHTRVCTVDTFRVYAQVVALQGPEAAELRRVQERHTLFLTFKHTLINTVTPHVSSGPYPASLLVLNIVSTQQYFNVFWRYQISKTSPKIFPFCSVPVQPRSPPQFLPQLSSQGAGNQVCTTRRETSFFFSGETYPKEEAQGIDS